MLLKLLISLSVLLAFQSSFWLASAFSLTSSPVTVSNPDNNGDWGNTPDGHMSVLQPNPNSADFIIFTIPNVRNLSPSQHLENIREFQPSNWTDGSNFGILTGHSFSILPPSTTGLRGDGTCYDNMCSQAYQPSNFWFMNIFRLRDSTGWSTQPNDLIAFVHNEDHYADYGGGCAWRSMGVSYSHDLGLTWERSVPVLTNSNVQPETPCPSGNGGLGDMTVVYDGARNRWVAIYPGNNGQLSLAESNDPAGQPGTWTKYNPQTGQTSSGFQGQDFPIPTLSNYGGSNPSVIWDVMHNQYVMVYKNWGSYLMWTTSTDLDTWTAPQQVPVLDTNAWYPTLVGYTDKYTTDGTASLYWSEQGNSRTCMQANVVF